MFHLGVIGSLTLINNESSIDSTPSCLENGKEHVGCSGEGLRLPLPQVGS